MLDHDLLCATDLTLAADQAVRSAVVIAERIGKQVTLLHVLNKEERSEEGQEAVMEAMRAQALKGGGNDRITYKLLDGDFMKRIAEETHQGHSLLVLGTHGPRGLRQTLFGADILKLVRHSAIPSLVVQEGTRTEGLLKHIVLPVAAHKDIERLLELVCVLAKAFASDVHVFQLQRPNEDPSEELLANKLKMLNYLEARGVPYHEVNEPSTSFSIGFAGSTIAYAQRIGSGCIAMMAKASDEYRYIADAEKERLLVNDALIPILCT
jgi:nucleotide-binding universal stress UspA family protein